jgi:hypothetical protein
LIFFKLRNRSRIQDAKMIHRVAEHLQLCLGFWVVVGGSFDEPGPTPSPKAFWTVIYS